MCVSQRGCLWYLVDDLSAELSAEQCFCLIWLRWREGVKGNGGSASLK